MSKPYDYEYLKNADEKETFVRIKPSGVIKK